MTFNRAFYYGSYAIDGILMTKDSCNFVTWDQKQGGNVYKIRTDKKAKPVQLTLEIGVYTQPVWSADNRD